MSEDKLRVAIVGSRFFKDVIKFDSVFDCFFQGNNIEIISGGEPNGVDAMAKEMAKKRGLAYKEFNPNEEKTGSFAQRCFMRNKKIVDYSDVILAFWDGRIEHCGTMLTMRLAVKSKKRMYAVGVNP